MWDCACVGALGAPGSKGDQLVSRRGDEEALQHLSFELDHEPAFCRGTLATEERLWCFSVWEGAYL